MRGPAATAFGNVLRHREALRLFQEDGRLRLENNARERALLPIAVGRNSWLFFGTDEHAVGGANLYSLIASCKPHGIEAEGYLAAVIRIMLDLRRGSYFELCSRYWPEARASLVSKDLELPVGPFAVTPRSSGVKEQVCPSATCVYGPADVSA